jgi:hypothetical protein
MYSDDDDYHDEIGDELAEIEDRNRAAIEGYCDLCERFGHTFRSCPARDDHYDEDY